MPPGHKLWHSLLSPLSSYSPGSGPSFASQPGKETTNYSGQQAMHMFHSELYEYPLNHLFICLCLVFPFLWNSCPRELPFFFFLLSMPFSYWFVGVPYMYVYISQTPTPLLVVCISHICSFSIAYISFIMVNSGF